MYKCIHGGQAAGAGASSAAHVHDDSSIDRLYPGLHTQRSNLSIIAASQDTLHKYILEIFK